MQVVVSNVFFYPLRTKGSWSMQILTLRYGRMMAQRSNRSWSSCLRTEWTRRPHCTQRSRPASFTHSRAQPRMPPTRCVYSSKLKGRSAQTSCTQSSLHVQNPPTSCSMRHLDKKYPNKPQASCWGPFAATWQNDLIWLIFSIGWFNHQLVINVFKFHHFSIHFWGFKIWKKMGANRQLGEIIGFRFGGIVIPLNLPQSSLGILWNPHSSYNKIFVSDLFSWWS